MEPTDGIGSFRHDGAAAAVVPLAEAAAFGSLGIDSAFAGVSSLREVELAPTDQRRVGGDVGALMLYTSPELIGNGIDLIPDSGDEPHTYSLVRERHLADGVSFGAVYPDLRPGTYTIEGSDQKVTIAGGRITTLEYHDGCCRIYYHPSPMSTFT